MLINRREADFGIFLRWAKVTKTGGFSSGNLVKPGINNRFLLPE
jgi:hypothetical protein